VVNASNYHVCYENHLRNVTFKIIISILQKTAVKFDLLVLIHGSNLKNKNLLVLIVHYRFHLMINIV
jgi:hypothetical protein